MSDLIKALAEYMVARKRSQVDPYVFFLGAGASISSGCSSMMQIVDSVLMTHASELFEDWQSQTDTAAKVNSEYLEFKKESLVPQKLEKFYEIWERLDNDTRYSILRKHLWENKSPSKGYSDLCYLIKMGYIKIILSTNLDNLVEMALKYRLDWYVPENYTLVVNGKDRPEEICDQLESPQNSFTLVKLHGTFGSKNSYAFTPNEIFSFEKKIIPSLSRIINQSLVVIGHSMEDRDICVLFQEDGKEIHFVNPSCPKAGSDIYTILRVRGRGSVVDGDNANFDTFFRLLKKYIEMYEKHQDINTSDVGISIEVFLKLIGYEHELKVPRSRFKNLPNLYVKPTEYNDICFKLERNHIIFIIGEPHMGKTYTALNILWDYYQNGYEPLHIRYDRLVGLLQRYDNSMGSFLPELFSSETGAPRIIHFDDPFGETLERRSDEFAKYLDTFLNLARQYEHLRIIVTTRHNIFKEAVSESHNLEKVVELEKDLRVHTSYRSEVLLDILRRYVQFYKPLWATDDDIIAKIEDQLPNLLPAPHNIEFFVRTSEKLNSLDDVLRHVETSKEMVKALGEWMDSLPDHEQIFLIWLEVCSTANVLFPNTIASEMNVEKAYLETLAYMFKEKHVSGIPPFAFSQAVDKFDMVFLETKDDTGLTKFDFVHPSYHEAFWYAIRWQSTLSRWWQLLKNDYEIIFRSWDDKVDIVQLSMIERYGSVNRNLDELLLISAKSDNNSEQLIAFEHMLERIEHFKNHPEFSYCARSLLKSDTSKFLELIRSYLDEIPQEILGEIALLVFKRSTTHQVDELLISNQYNFSKIINKDPRLIIWMIGTSLQKDFKLDDAPHSRISYVIDMATTFANEGPLIRTNPYEIILLSKETIIILLNYHKVSRHNQNLFCGAISSTGLNSVKICISELLHTFSSCYTLEDILQNTSSLNEKSTRDILFRCYYYLMDHIENTTPRSTFKYININLRSSDL